VINRREWLPGSADEGYAEHGYVAAVERADPGCTARLISRFWVAGSASRGFCWKGAPEQFSPEDGSRQT
jgi:hypothetical protein